MNRFSVSAKLVVSLVVGLGSVAVTILGAPRVVGVGVLGGMTLLILMMMVGHPRLRSRVPLMARLPFDITYEGSAAERWDAEASCLLREGEALRTYALTPGHDVRGLNVDIHNWDGRVHRYVELSAPGLIEPYEALPGLERLGLGITGWIESPSRRSPAFIDERLRLVVAIVRSREGEQAAWFSG